MIQSYWYNFSVQTLNTAAFQRPQNRERVFILGTTGKLDINIKSEFLKVSLNDFVEKEVDEKYYMTLEKFESIKFESSKRLYDRLAPTLPTSQGGYQQPKILWSKEERKILSKDLYFLHNIQKREFVTTGFKNICPTLMSSDAKGNQKQLFGVDEETKEFFIRSLTPREYERLQGFEDDYTSICSDSQRYKQLWNAVSPPVITGISKSGFLKEFIF